MDQKNITLLSTPVAMRDIDVHLHDILRPKATQHVVMNDLLAEVQLGAEYAVGRVIEKEKSRTTR